MNGGRTVFRKILIVAGLSAALAFAAGVAAAATTTWDTLTGATIDSRFIANVYGEQSSSGQVSTALIFEASVTGTVVSIDVALSRWGRNTPANVIFSFHTSGGSVPGTLLGSAPAVEATSFNPLIQTVSGWGSTLLTAGQTYWLVAEAATPVDQLYLHRTDPEAAGQRAFFNGSEWQVTSNVVPAARITVSPIPLPASGVLLILGLGGLGALGRRRRLSA